MGSFRAGDGLGLGAILGSFGKLGSGRYAVPEGKVPSEVYHGVEREKKF